jgi:hypothetical protein
MYEFMALRRLTRAALVRLALAGSLAVALLALSACNKVQAKTPGPPPAPLQVPDPPLRLQTPIEVEPPPPPPPATEKPAAPVTQPSRAKPTPTPTATPTPPPSPAGETSPPPPVMQTSNQAQNEAKAREHLRSAENDLSKVEPKSLPRPAQGQYESAQKFVRMTREALNARNFVYAAFCAEKAATLAALLVKD